MPFNKNLMAGTPKTLSTGIVHSFTQPTSIIALTRTGSFNTIISEQCRAEREME